MPSNFWMAVNGERCFVYPGGFTANGPYTVKMNMLYLINKIVATDYKQYYLLNWTN